VRGLGSSKTKSTRAGRITATSGLTPRWTGSTLPDRTRATRASGPATSRTRTGVDSLTSRVAGQNQTLPPSTTRRAGTRVSSRCRWWPELSGPPRRAAAGSPRSAHDTRIEDYVDRPHEDPGHQRRPAAVGATAATLVAGTPAKPPRRLPTATAPTRRPGGLGRDGCPARRAEPHQRSPIALSQPAHQAHETSTVVSAKGRSTPSRCPRPSTKGSRSQSNAATTPAQTPKSSAASA
jgi:hypothetical protein